MNRNRKQPPRFALMLLKRMRGFHSDYHIEGDLTERFHQLTRERSAAFASCWFWIQSLVCYGHYRIQKWTWSFTMIKSYLKIALRTLTRQKTFSFINIFGLSAGLACSLMMFLFIRHEASFDRFHQNYNTIYRLIRTYPGESGEAATLIGPTPAPLSKTMKLEFPEVVRGTCMREMAGLIETETSRLASNGLYADENFSDLFSFDILQSAEDAPLKAPFSLVITQSLAARLFGDEDPLGKTIHFIKQKNFDKNDDQQVQFDATVKALAANPPQNSHIQFEYLLSISTLTALSQRGNPLDSWGASDYYNYVQLHPGTAHTSLHPRLADYSPRFRGGDPGKYTLQPMQEIHWGEAVLGELPGSRTGSRKTLLLLTAIAVVILLIAGLNYTNLATGQYAKRMREVGIRRVIGAKQGQLLLQFLGESILLTLISGGVAIMMTALLLPGFGRFLERELTLNMLSEPFMVALFSGMVLLTGLVSGLYPALVLNRIRPVTILKGSMPRSGGSSLRNVLVVIQFTISIFLLICTFTVSSQLEFIRHKDIGYNRQQVAVIPLKDHESRSNSGLIMNQLRSDSRIVSVSGSEYHPLEINNISTLHFTGEDGEEKNLQAYYSRIGYDFMKLYQMSIIEGRSFSRDFPTDLEFGVILNETAARMTGLDDPVGQTVDRRGATVIGVVKDFNQSSLHDPIRPYIFFLDPDAINFISVRTKPGDMASALSFIQTVVENHSENFDFDYYFMDERFDRKYKSDERFGDAFKYASILAVLVACLGVFGLASFTAQRRTKEIAVRKVAGASVPDIVTLLSREYVALVLVANLAAWPLAWGFMRGWLQNFVYRVSAGIQIYLYAGLITLAVTLISVSVQSFKAAMANPVRSLKYE